MWLNQMDRWLLATVCLPCRAVLRIKITHNPSTGSYSAGSWVVEPMQWPGLATPRSKVMGEWPIQRVSD